MFLRNYDNYMAGLNLLDALNISVPVVNNSTLLFAEGYYNQRTANGAITSIYYCNNMAQFHTLMSLSAKGICLGDGDDAVSYDDYKLSGEVISNKLIEVSKSISYNPTTHKFRKTLVATYTNSGNTDLTISEWGLWRINAQDGANNTIFNHESSVAVLVYRAVLDDPIVIEAGTTATLTFSIDIPMPNHP